MVTPALMRNREIQVFPRILNQVQNDHCLTVIQAGMASRLCPGRQMKRQLLMSADSPPERGDAAVFSAEQFK